MSCPRPSPNTVTAHATATATATVAAKSSLRTPKQDGWLRQDDEFSDEEIDRFDSGKSNNNANNNSDSTGSANNAGTSKKAIGFVGEGVRIGAGAAAGGGGGAAAAAVAAAAAAVVSGGGDGSGSGTGAGEGTVVRQQQAFVSSPMFRRKAITEEEARAKPVLRALSSYRAVPFPGGGGASFPVSVVEAMVEKPRRKDTGEGGGEGKEGSGDGKVKKVKVRVCVCVCVCVYSVGPLIDS